MQLPPGQSYPGEQCFDIMDLLDYTGPLPILGFDQFMLAHSMISGAVMGNYSYDELPTAVQTIVDEFGSLVRMGALFFACNDNTTCSAVQEFVDYMNYTSPFFNTVYGGLYRSEESAMNWVHDNPDKTWATLVFNTFDLTNGVVDYTLRLNWTQGYFISRMILVHSPQYLLRIAPQMTYSKAWILRFCNIISVDS